MNTSSTLTTQPTQVALEGAMEYSRKTEGSIITDYTWDDENRLINITKTGGTIITYTYDPFGRRIEKNVNGTITTYVYDNQSIIAEYDQSGNIKAKYTHGLNIDEPLSVKQGTATYFYHTDGLGSIVTLTNNLGKAAKTYTYDSFGNITAQTGTITQPFTYTAREYDTETGMYFYRARYYDPRAGRFISKDLISFAGGDVNLYNYVGANPINYIDPEGLVGPAIALPLIYIIPPAMQYLLSMGVGIGLGVAASKAIDNVSDECKTKRCRPCIPPLGTIGYEVHTGDIRGAHKGIDHVKLRTMKQHPIGTPPPFECQCYWSKPSYLLNTRIPPSGAVPITIAGGGGVEYC